MCLQLFVCIVSWVLPPDNCLDFLQILQIIDSRTESDYRYQKMLRCYYLSFLERQGRTSKSQVLLKWQLANLQSLVPSTIYRKECPGCEASQKLSNQIGRASCRERV